MLVERSPCCKREDGRKEKEGKRQEPEDGRFFPFLCEGFVNETEERIEFIGEGQGKRFTNNIRDVSVTNTGSEDRSLKKEKAEERLGVDRRGESSMQRKPKWQKQSFWLRRGDILGGVGVTPELIREERPEECVSISFQLTTTRHRELLCCAYSCKEKYVFSGARLSSVCKISKVSRIGRVEK
jgi:hypothetical protein